MLKYLKLFSRTRKTCQTGLFFPGYFYRHVQLREKSQDPQMRRSQAVAHLIAANATQFRIMSAKAFRKPVPCSAKEWYHMRILVKFDKLQMAERRQSISKEQRCQPHWSFFTVDVTSFLTYERSEVREWGQRNSGCVFINKWHADSYPTSCHSVSKISA